MKKLYTFNVQVRVTLDDQDTAGFSLPDTLSIRTKKQIVGWLSETNENTDGHFEDSVYESTNCPVTSIYICLE